LPRCNFSYNDLTHHCFYPCSSAKQKEDFALVSTVGFAAAIGSRLFVGLFMDKQGPKTTAILCSLTCLTAFLLLAIPNEEELDTYFLPAWILLSIGGSGLHLTGFHFTNLFRADGKKLASVAISAAFGASSAIFPLMQVFSQYLEVKLKSMAIVYAVIVFIIGANNLLIQPWDKITSGSPHKVSFEIYKKEWWVRDLKTKPFLRSIFMEVLKFDFYGEMLCYTFCLLLLTHYISTSGQLMHELGDSSFSNAPNAWTDYIVARMAGVSALVEDIIFCQFFLFLTNDSNSTLLLACCKIVVQRTGFCVVSSRTNHLAQVPVGPMLPNTYGCECCYFYHHPNKKPYDSDSWLLSSFFRKVVSFQLSSHVHLGQIWGGILRHS
jgi:MFS family permease